MAVDNDFHWAVVKSITELSSSGYIALDPNLTIKYSNPAASAFLGMDPATIQESPILNFFQDLSPTPEAEYIVSQLKNSLDLKAPGSLGITVSSGFIARSSLRLEISPLLSEDGKILGLLLEFQSAQEEPENESPLVEERIRYNGVYDHSLDAIFLADDQARYIDANPAACSLTGYRRDELLRLSVWDITSDGFLQTARELWQEFIAEGYQRGEYAIQRKDGSLVEVEYIARANINPGLHLSILRDITERKRAYDELKQRSEELARSNSRITALSNVAGELLVSLEPDQMMHILTEELRRLGTQYVITIIDPEDGSTVIRYSSLDKGMLARIRAIIGLQIQGLRLSNQQLSPFAELMEQRKGIFLPDPLSTAMISFPNIPKKFLKQALKLLGFGESTPVISLPLVIKDQLIGGMTIWGANLRKDDMAVFTIFANQVAIALESARLFEQAKMLVAAEGRNQLARELHDSVVQAMFGIYLYTDATEMALRSGRLEAATENIGELRQLTREVMRDLRLLIFQLHPPVLEGDGLLGALKALLDAVESKAGITAHLETDGEFKLTPEQEGELYRIAQEALNNVLKHAYADEIKVELKGEGGKFRMTIEDNGIGFDPEFAEEAAGQGLRNLQERAKKLGATCTITSAPGQGSKIIIEMDL